MKNMKTDVFCPVCDGFLLQVNPDVNDPEFMVKICPFCNKGVIIEFGCGRLEKRVV